MDKWLQLEDSRLKRLNNDGISLIKKELEYAYVNKDTKGLEVFLKHRNNAIKKANIAAPEGNAFHEIYKVGTYINIVCADFLVWTLVSYCGFAS